MFEDYVRRCRAGEVKLGQPYLYRQLLPPWILNFPTKDHWRSVSRLSDIVRGLVYLEEHYQAWGITSLAVPPLGTGHGQLDWRVVDSNRRFPVDTPGLNGSDFSSEADRPLWTFHFRQRV